jgi:mannose-6-phosphate isomerase class I
MEELVLKDPKEVLGSKPLKLYGPKMGLLLKLTQAKGNSYQIHVRNKDETTRWLFKPESWYYFEPGVLTLGVNRGVDWEAYRMTCLRINDLAFSLSEKVKSGNIEVDDARVELNDYIANHNPEAYVNRITVGPGQVVDLSACGIHHSWEEDETIAPLGNVLFEVQKNVYDPVSTIRAYDKGKIKDNGSIRELQIEDYFNYIDRSETANNPNNHFRDTKVIKQTNNLTVKNAFNTTEYSMDEIILNGLIEDEVFTTSGSFHHLFVRSGKIEVQTDNTKLTVTRGFSAFIPANTGGYRVTADKEAVILKTYI